MFQFLATIIISALLAVGSIFSLQDTKLGAFTTLNSTDRLTDFVTTYNNNLNKSIEVGTTTVQSITSLPNLATVGTLTAGTWNATAISVSKGGTGTTSPSPFLVLLGDGQYGITHASTTGTSGQFLTSNGAGLYPSWTTSSIDQTLDYNFTGTYFGIKNLNASSTAANPLVLNGSNYSFPSGQPASSTVPVVSGSGDISFLPYNRLLAAPANTVPVPNATTTLSSTILIANSLKTGGIIEGLFQSTTTSIGTDNVNVNLSLGGRATTTCGMVLNSFPSATTTWHFAIKANSSISQTLSCNFTREDILLTTQNNPAKEGPLLPDWSIRQANENLATDLPLLLQVYLDSTATGNFYGMSLKLWNI